VGLNRPGFRGEWSLHRSQDGSVCTIGSGPSAIVATKRLDVGEPAETIGAARAFFVRALAEGIALDAIGIGSFGPIELRQGHPHYGWITTTPKAGWSGTDIVGPFAAGIGLPVGFDTDVNAAALAEGRWGAARGLRSFIYLTLGTGVGGGAVVDGRLIHGLGHPEMGHIAVERRAGDVFAGVCAFHGDCFEGMASGPAVAARFGRRAETLEGADREAAVTIVAFYLAAGVRSLVYALAQSGSWWGAGYPRCLGSRTLRGPSWPPSSGATRPCRNMGRTHLSKPPHLSQWRAHWAPDACPAGPGDPAPRLTARRSPLPLRG